MSTQNITSLDGSSYEAIHSSIPQNIFSYLKMFSMQCRKSITVKDNKEKMNIANFINILYVTRMTQITKSILHHGRVVHNYCCVV